MLTASDIGKIGGSMKTPAKLESSRANGRLGGRPIKSITMNEDGISISGCSYIYAPKGQAGEYSALATNPYRGCGHGCAYCYVPQAIRMDRREFNKGAYPRNGYKQGLLRDAIKYRDAGIKEQVMLSFTTDPYHAGDTSLTRETLKIIAAHGLGFCTLTKGGTRSLRDIDIFRPSRDAFATTMTSLDDTFSKKWEPNAALPCDRIKALKEFHNKGIFTWISLEPTLDVDASIEIVKRTHSFVDLFKIGRVNYLPMTKTTDWEEYTHKIIDVCKSLGVSHYIKKDLQCFLPKGYNNPLRVNQHHG
jgi:hypothetical protein